MLGSDRARVSGSQVDFHSFRSKLASYLRIVLLDGARDEFPATRVGRAPHLRRCTSSDTKPKSRPHSHCWNFVQGGGSHEHRAGLRPHVSQCNSQFIGKHQSRFLRRRRCLGRFCSLVACRGSRTTRHIPRIPPHERSVSRLRQGLRRRLQSLLTGDHLTPEAPQS